MSAITNTAWRINKKALSRGWKLCPLGEALCKSDAWIEIDPIKTYKEITIHLWGKGVTLRGEKQGSQIGSAKRLKVNSGQFILSRIDARNGAFGLIPKELDGAIVSNDFPVFQPQEDKLMPEYIGWLSRSRAFIKACKMASEGTTNRVRLKEKKFYRTEIPLPPLSEQQRIVAKIEQLAARIEEANELRASVNDLTYVFTISLHKRLSRSRIVKIKDLLELSEDRQEILNDGSYPQVGIRGFGGGLFPKPALKGSNTKYRYFNRLKRDQIVLSQVKGWEGAIDVCPSIFEGYYASPEYRTFDCKPAACHPAYFNHLIKTSWFHSLLGNATRGQGARRERTRPELFLAIELPMPKFSEQKKAAEILHNLHEIPVIHQQTAPQLDALLPSILDKAFKGEL